MGTAKRFWNWQADRYARQPIADEASYRKKLAITWKYLAPHRGWAQDLRSSAPGAPALHSGRADVGLPAGGDPRPAADLEEARIAAYWQVLNTGSFSEVFVSNAVDGFKAKMEFQVGIFYRFLAVRSGFYQRAFLR